MFTADEKSRSFVLAVRILVEQIVELDCSSKRKIVTNSVFYMNRPAKFVKTGLQLPSTNRSPQPVTGLTKKFCVC